ncbi:MAG: acetyl-CoA C-acyltransferase, partial [Desulfobacterales bacterium]
MREVVLVSGARTAIGAFGGGLKSVSVVDMGALVMKAALKRAGLRPVPSEDVKALAPEKLKGRGLVAPEKTGYDWDESAMPVNVDEVIMGNVLQAC